MSRFQVRCSLYGVFDNDGQGFTPQQAVENFDSYEDDAKRHPYGDAPHTHAIELLGVKP